MPSSLFASRLPIIPGPKRRKSHAEEANISNTPASEPLPPMLVSTPTPGPSVRMGGDVDIRTSTEWMKPGVPMQRTNEMYISPTMNVDRNRRFSRNMEDRGGRERGDLTRPWLSPRPLPATTPFINAAPSTPTPTASIYSLPTVPATARVGGTQTSLSPDIRYRTLDESLPLGFVRRASRINSMFVSNVNRDGVSLFMGSEKDQQGRLLDRGAKRVERLSEMGVWGTGCPKIDLNLEVGAGLSLDGYEGEKSEKEGEEFVQRSDATNVGDIATNANGGARTQPPKSITTNPLQPKPCIRLLPEHPPKLDLDFNFDGLGVDFDRYEEDGNMGERVGSTPASVLHGIVVEGDQVVGKEDEGRRNGGRGNEKTDEKWVTLKNL